MIKWHHKPVFYLRTLSIAKYTASVSMEHWYRATGQRCYGAALLMLSSGQWTKAVNLHTKNGSFWKRQALDGNERRRCFLLLHFRIISNLESCQQNMEDVLQASARTAGYWGPH